MAWSPDGKYLASNGGDWEKEHVEGWIWDAVTWKQKVALDGEDLNWLNSLSWGQNGVLAAGTQDGKVILYDAESGKTIARTPQHDPLSACISSDGRLIADTNGGIWKVGKEDPSLSPSWDPSRTLSRIESVAWSPDGKMLASSPRFGDGTIRLWTADGAPDRSLKGHEGDVYRVEWSPDGRRLASSGWDGTIRLWAADGTAGPILKGHEGWITYVAWSPDGKQLASAGYDDKTVRLWSADGTAGPVLKGHTDRVRQVAWSPDGKTLASAGVDSDHTVRLWSADGTPGPILKDHESGVPAIAWSRDGLLASLSDDNTLRLWKADGTPVLKWSVPGGGESVAWSPDGQRLATAFQDGTVRLWSADGAPGSVIQAHHDNAKSVAWSKDGKRLVSGGWDGVVRMMDGDGEPLWTLVTLSDNRSVTFSAAGEVLHGDPKVIEETLVYVVEKDDGRIEVLRPSEFQKRIGPSVPGGG